MDAATTGLLYVGNGQYYNPATGRFLTRDALPGSTNPYVPLDPIGAMIGPLGFVAMLYGRKKGKRSRVETILLVLLLVSLVSVGLAGCRNFGTAAKTPTAASSTSSSTSSDSTVGPATANSTATPAGPGGGAATSQGSTATATQPPTDTPAVTATPCPTPTSTPGPTPTQTAWATQHGVQIAREARNLKNNASQYYVWGAFEHPDDENASDPPPRKTPEAGDTWGWNGSIDLLERTGGRVPIVCADVISLSYKNAGLDLAQTFPAWYAGAPKDATRDIWMLHILLRDSGQEHRWGMELCLKLGI